jgi:hypothetical protein
VSIYMPGAIGPWLPTSSRIALARPRGRSHGFGWDFPHDGPTDATWHRRQSASRPSHSRPSPFALIRSSALAGPPNRVD